MELINIKVEEAKQSATNPKGRTDGPDFDELVASIKEKGVLVPVLVRKMTGKDKVGKYEVIAGNRRLAAAREAGLTEIPANLVEMDDIEAREAQIVENMQRKDVHPLDEADAFKFLAEESKHDIPEIAKRVGKSDTYVRERLGLTNLIEKAKKAYRDGEMSLTSAILISKIEEDNVQKKVLDEVIKYGAEGNRLKKLIADESYKFHSTRPWAQDEDFAKILGDDKRATLFDRDAEGKEDPAEHAKKMAAFIEMTIRKHEEKGEKIVKISSGYGQPDGKGVLGRDQYVVLDSKAARKAATEDILGIVVEGWDDKGRVYHISTKDTKRSENTAHKITPEEKAKRKKDREKAAAKEKETQDEWVKAIGKIGEKLPKKHIDLLFGYTLDRCGASYQQPLVKALGLEPVIEEHAGWEKGKTIKTRNYEATLKQYADTDKKKMQVIFGLLMKQPQFGEYSNNTKDFIKELKRF